MIGMSSSWLATKGFSIKDSIERVFGMGFDLVEVGAAHKYEDKAVETVLGIRKKYLSKSFTVHALFPPYKNGSSYPLNLSDPNEHDRTIKIVKKMFDISERLGSDFVGIHGGYAGKVKWVKGENGFKNLKVVEKMPLDEARTNMKIVLEDLVHIAEEKNMKLAVEICPPEGSSITTNPEAFEWIFKKFKTDHLGLLLDIGHLHRSSKKEGYDSHSFVEKFKDKIIEIHIHDCKGNIDHTPFGEGDMDFGSYFRIIGKEKMQGVPLVFEYNSATTEAQVLKGKKLLEKEIEKLD